MAHVPSVSQALLDKSLQQKISLSSYEEWLVRNLIGLLDSADADLEARLSKAFERTAPLDTTARLQALRKELLSVNAVAYQQVGQELTAEMLQLTGEQTGALADAVESVLPFKFSATRPAETLLHSLVTENPFQGRLLGAISADGVNSHIENLAGNRAAAVLGQLQIGVVQGESWGQLLPRIRGTAAGNYEDGVLQIGRRQAEALTRTAVQYFTEAARDSLIQENADLFQGVMWVSTLDRRVTPICAVRDGKVWNLNYQPIQGNNYDWLGGPGRAHWQAIAEGTPVRTISGVVPIERVAVGDLVLTHRGRWRPVTATRQKNGQGHVVRTVNLETGGVLRATDDHPVLTTGGWRFVGNLRVGDELLYDREEVAKPRRRTEHPPAQDCPAAADETSISIQRTLKLVAGAVHLDSDQQIRASKVDDAAMGRVLTDPSRRVDQSCMHHDLALAHLLAELGGQRLRNHLAGLERNTSAAHSLGAAFVVTPLLLGGLNSFLNFRDRRRVVRTHPLRVSGVGVVSLLRKAMSPMIRATRSDARPQGEISADLLGATSNDQAVATCVAGEAPVSQPVLALDRTQGLPAPEVEFVNKASKFVHARILSLELQLHNGALWDLEIDEDASYVAAGIVVSNCRSSSVPVFKSVDDLQAAGIAPESLAPQERAAFDHPVPITTDVEDWLRGQPGAVQEDVLGVARAAEFQDGAALDEVWDRRTLQGRP